MITSLAKAMAKTLPPNALNSPKQTFKFEYQPIFPHKTLKGVLDTLQRPPLVIN